ncbi:ethanolamine ammonia-lyase reactivating factor EutA [Lucifera butyrica]|uniref:ethanolamine ammonia-lyase reactivating factor EutA n=1 Tax=Lucifera butyrica TaxID=1351585 RepID=UPI001A9E7D06|nr:ethanolamine ammonia-lyase reactivating factor EutA [Lucifera butyrica]
MKDEFLSVGIDIGTTTTQVIFSKITVQNTATSFLIPEVKITNKQIIYKSKIHFTPFVSMDKINLKKIKEMIEFEYDKAGVQKHEIATGAIIITGETARKKNAERVLSILSDFAGDFVVATAGPHLESVLAGYGAGAAEASKHFTETVINFDIGGGTTNAAIFREGEVIDSFALDIGGRLIQIDQQGMIRYISDKVIQFIKSMHLNLAVGTVARLTDLKILTDIFAEMLVQINSNQRLHEEAVKLFIGQTHKGLEAEKIMFSGGVAEFIYSDYEIGNIKDVILFGDIGPLLGYSIRKAFEQHQHRLVESREKIRATVIGAGSHSIKISGSTILFDDDLTPLKNIPIIKLTEDENIDQMFKAVGEKIKRYENIPVALAFQGPKSPSYLQIKEMAKAIIAGFATSSQPVIVIVENDFAKALGQIIMNMSNNIKKVICIDQIKVNNGDYIDIGKSIANVVPTVVKTLIFK